MILKENYYTISSEGEGIYRIFSPEGVYMDLFTGSRQALLLDTGLGFGDLKKTISSITKLPLTVVNTHGHYDHSNGNTQFLDCSVYMHPADWEVYDYYCRPENRKHILECAKHTKKGWNSNEYINIVPEDLKEEAYIHGTPVRLCPLKEGMTFDLGGITLDVIEVPGHTKGSCALLHRETKRLYIGDAANAHLVLSVFAATLQNYRQTLYKLKALDFIKMRTGHEQGWIDKTCLDDYLDCITDPDPDNYITVSSPVRPDETDYMYIRRGYTPADSDKPGFASFIVKDKISG